MLLSTSIGTRGSSFLGASFCGAGDWTFGLLRGVPDLPDFFGSRFDSSFSSAIFLLTAFDAALERVVAPDDGPAFFSSLVFGGLAADGVKPE